MNPFGIAFLVIALGLFGGAWWAYGRRRAIADTPTSKVRSMAIGPVELQGKATAAPGQELVRGPFTDTPCVYWEYKVEEQRTRKTKNGSETYWATVDSGRSKAAFGLSDDTGIARIDQDGADLPAPATDRFGSGFRKDPTPRIQAFLTQKDISFETFFGWNKKMRFIENRLEEGTPIFLHGNATRPEHAAGEGNAALVVERKGDGPFLVSVGTEQDVLRRWTWSFWGFFLGALAAAAIGTLLLNGGGP